MANLLYPKGKEGFLKATIGDLTAVTVKIALVKSTYAYSAAHQFLSDLGANTLAPLTALATITITNGVFNAANATIVAPAAGNTINYLACYVDTGVAGTSPLLFLLDTATGLPLTTNGGNVLVNWDTGSNKIFAL